MSKNGGDKGENRPDVHELLNTVMEFVKIADSGDPQQKQQALESGRELKNRLKDIDGSLMSIILDFTGQYALGGRTCPNLKQQIIG